VARPTEPRDSYASGIQIPHSSPSHEATHTWLSGLVSRQASPGARNEEKHGSGQTVDSVNIPARELGTRLCTRATTSSHEGITRPPEASRNALRPRRSPTTPPRPRGLHPAGALACTHRNETQPRKTGPLAKKCDKSLQASINTPFEARGLLLGTIIRGTPKTPNLSW
jgi:hypothetical protein